MSLINAVKGNDKSKLVIREDIFITIQTQPGISKTASMKIIYPFLLVIFLVLISWLGIEILQLDYFFGIIVPYAAVSIFTIGFIYRCVRWAVKPVPFHIPVVCGQQKSLSWIKNDRIDSPVSTTGVIIRMALEILFFRSLFKNEKAEIKANNKLIFGGNKYLWLGGLLFHWSLLIILFRHLRLFIEPVPATVLFADRIDQILQLGIPTLYITDLLILICLTYLFLRRVIFPQIRYISIPSDYFALFLIVSIVLSGILMRHVIKIDLVEIKAFALSLIILKPVVATEIGSSFYIHLFLVSIIVSYFPFSKLVHAPGMLLSPTKNLKNNSRMQRHVNPWNHPVRFHTYSEWEEEFEKHIRAAGLPLENDQKGK